MDYRMVSSGKLGSAFRARTRIAFMPSSKQRKAGFSAPMMPASHGDHHGLWIDPQNSNRIGNANDGGASISMDGGKTWTTQNNQPTAQFYHVAVDNAFPYHIYGAQQDNSNVC